MIQDSDPLLATYRRAVADNLFHVTAGAGETLDSADFFRAADAAADRLFADGVGAGDLILYQGGQRIEALILFWAAMQRGAVLVPIDDGWPEFLVRRVTGALAPRLVVAPVGRQAFFNELFPAARHIPLGTGAWDDWLGREAAPAPPALIDRHAPAAYLFTSGSTGIPKAVVLSRAALAHGARLTIDRFDWQPGESLVNLPDPHTMSGLRNGLIAALAGGMRWHVFGPERRGTIFALVEELGAVGCERLVAGPVLIRQMAMLGERIAPAALGRLKAIYCTGATLSPVMVERFHARFGIPIVNYYGLTETGGLCISQRLQGWAPGDQSLGTAAGAELRVVDAAGVASAHGIGELQVRSGQLMSGYFDDPERTAARLDHGWLRTGDQMRIEPDGRCFLIGRSDAFIKTGSTDRVAPEEIESVIEDHPAVVEAAVLGVDSGQDYDRIAALVVLSAPPKREDLAVAIAAFVRERLGAVRTPSQIRFVTGLPRGANGKIARSQLEALLDAAA